MSSGTEKCGSEAGMFEPVAVTRLGGVTAQRRLAFTARLKVTAALDGSVSESMKRLPEGTGCVRFADANFL